MNDFQMNQLASDRRHDFHREAAASRLASDARASSRRLPSRISFRVKGPRRSLRAVFAR
jgi:hypothetical protein